jgi:hypothetical protein
MNIYINFDTIIETINSNGDSKNQTSIYTLLEVLMQQNFSSFRRYKYF